MAHNLTVEYLKLLNELQTFNISRNIADSLSGYLKFIYRSELENHFSAPMLWIGMYIALASLVCIVAMVADIFHGFRSKKLWFPCKYFRINSAFLTLLSVAMKLPVDLTGSMPGTVDQVAKLGSMAFMCTMMANLLPCLATMNDGDLVSNIAALCVLVITLVVNVCIQIQTGVVSIKTYSNDPRITSVVSSSRNVKSLPTSIDNYTILHIIYVTLLLVLLVLHVCSSLAVLKSRTYIVSKYQQGHEMALRAIQQSPERLVTIEKLQEHVKSHWLMVGSGNPQFVFTTCFPSTSASGMICVFVTILHILTMSWTIEAILAKDYDSDYGWSMIVIVIVQFLGVVIGTIVPLARCFAILLSFDVLSIKIISSRFSVFKVESYWTSKLYEWKDAIIKFPFPRYSMMVIQILIRLILSFFIGFQKGVVVVCKILGLIPLMFKMCVTFLCELNRFLKYKSMFISSREDTLEQNLHEILPFILQLEFDFRLAMRTYKRLSISLKQLIQKSEESQPRYLIELIKKNSTSSFQGVEMFSLIDHHHIKSLLSEITSKSEVTYPDCYCWRLSVVTLTTIAVSLPEISKQKIERLIERLMESVREGLAYVELVEESLNVTYDYRTLQKVAETLWNEVYVYQKWLGNKLQDPSLKMLTCEQIVEWYNETAKKTLSLGETNAYGTKAGNDNYLSFCAAHSMYHITRMIKLTNLLNSEDEVCQHELFDRLSLMIADIIAACLTNLPRVILMKCHTKREAHVKDAVQLLGKTSQIINILKDRDIPNMDPDEIPFLDKWVACMKNP